MKNLTVTVGDWTQEYVLYETTAPKRYDYHGAITVQESEDRRWVLIQKTRSLGQCNRWGSGLFRFERNPGGHDASRFAGKVIGSLFQTEQEG